MYSLASTDDLLVRDLWRERGQADGEMFGRENLPPLQSQMTLFQASYQ